MKTSTLLSITLAGALCPLAAAHGQEQTIESMPPVVVKATPESGTLGVAPGEAEIRVTFSKPMADGSWSWSTAWKDSTPESTDKPRYEADGKTCVMKVKLEPGKTYAYWLNSQNFHNFRDRQGHAAVPYLLIFHTKSTTAISDPGRDSKEVARQKLQLAELDLKTIEKQYAVGAATREELERAKSAVSIAGAELKGDTQEVARLKLQLAETELELVEKNYETGLVTQLEYEHAKSSLVLARAEYTEALHAGHDK